MAVRKNTQLYLLCEGIFDYLHWPLEAATGGMMNEGIINCSLYKVVYSALAWILKTLQKQFITWTW